MISSPNVSLICILLDLFFSLLFLLLLLFFFFQAKILSMVEVRKKTGLLNSTRKKKPMLVYLDSKQYVINMYLPNVLK